MAHALDNIPELADAFSSLQYDPNATRSIALFGCEYTWSDERPNGHENHGETSISQALRYLNAYRDSLIRETPFAPLAPFWNAFQNACPTWPGFRKERCKPTLVVELDAEIDAMLNQMSRYAEICDRKRKLRTRDLPKRADTSG